MDAFSDAWAAYRNVLELVQQVPHDLDVVGLTLLAAEAADLADEADAALPLLERVRAAATTDTVRATAAARTGWILFRRGGGDAAHRAFQDALALLPPDETSVLAARIQAGLALLAAGWSRLDEAAGGGRRGSAHRACDRGPPGDRSGPQRPGLRRRPPRSARRGRSPCSGRRSPSRGRARTRRTWERPTSTSATSSAWPACSAMPWSWPGSASAS